MTRLPSPADPRLEQAQILLRQGKLREAETLLVDLLDEQPHSLPALEQLARLAWQRGERDRAIDYLQRAAAHHPERSELAMELALMCANNGQQARASELLTSLLREQPQHPPAWLLLGQLRQAGGDPLGAARAWYQAITYAQAQGLWRGVDSTPPHLLHAVKGAIAHVRQARREFLWNAYADLRDRFGAEALKRVDRALQTYLGEIDVKPSDARQRPKVLYFPDLPSEPYLDPYLQPWANDLRDAFPSILAEAQALLAEGAEFVDFMGFKPGDSTERYLGGTGNKPAWDAFFFYRHGQRFDANHTRCPNTSAVLESIELCRIRSQAPEICFSFLSAGSHIKPHYGVTNTRVVMHLPLIVPPGCALNIIDAGEHEWQPGRLMMFDDTYQHEAWNRSDQDRLILLMDCWNPYLRDVEREAVKRLVEALTEFEAGL